LLNEMLNRQIDQISGIAHGIGGVLHRCLRIRNPKPLFCPRCPRFARGASSAALPAYFAATGHDQSSRAQYQSQAGQRP
jgi:hypothetical protein